MSSESVRNLCSLRSVWILCALLGSVPLAAAPGDELWDNHFGVPGANGSVYAMVTLGDDLYVRGRFSEIGGVAASCIARWDGTNWHSLGGGVSAEFYPIVLALAVMGDQLYAGGTFATAGGVRVNDIARWDGTRWWPLGSGADGPIHGVQALASDGRNLYVGGTFTRVGGIAANHIARWDGAQWSALGQGVTWWQRCADGPCEVGIVRALAVGASRVYVGGEFDRAGAVSATNIAAWDGSAWGPLDLGISGGVNALATDGRTLYAGGTFARAAGLAVTNIARWDGSAWLPLGYGIGQPGGVHALLTVPAAVYVGGFFSSGGGVAAGSIAMWGGGTWVSLGSGTSHSIGLGGVGAVGAMAASGANLFIGGTFTSVGGKPATNIALWHIPHALGITHQAGQVTVSWPATGSNLVLETSTSLPATNWVEVPEPPIVAEDHQVVTNRAAEPGQFYRLRRKP